MEGQTGAKTDRAELKNYPPPPPPLCVSLLWTIKKTFMFGNNDNFLFSQRKTQFSLQNKKENTIKREET